MTLRQAFVLLPALSMLHMALIAPSAAAQSFMLKDTVIYKNEMYTSSFTRLYSKGGFIDSIETAFGVHAVGADSIVYVQVETQTVGRYTGTYFTGLVLFSGGKKIALDTSLLYYNEHFSSPAIIGKHLFYWGFDDKRILAVRTDFPRNLADTIALSVEGSMITDSPFHFCRPKNHPDGIVFALADGQKFIVALDMKSVRKIIPDKIISPVESGIR